MPDKKKPAKAAKAAKAKKAASKKPVSKLKKPAEPVSKEPVSKPKKRLAPPREQVPAIASIPDTAKVSTLADRLSRKVPAVSKDGHGDGHEDGFHRQQAGQMMDSRKRHANAPHIVVIARAGTGKTWTGINGMRVMRGMEPQAPPSDQQQAIWDTLLESKDASSICFTAYNNPIATDIQTKIEESGLNLKGCMGRTLNSLGNGVVMNAFRSSGRYLNVTKYRSANIIGRLLNKSGQDLKRERPILLSAVTDLVDKVKVNLADHDDVEALAELVHHYDIDTEGENRQEIYHLAQRVLELSLDPLHDGCIDFNDQIWLPIKLNLPVRRHDVLLVDEGQDLSKARHRFGMMAGDRIGLIGDPAQAIYGFSGASCESMAEMTEYLTDTSRNCVTLPLTFTRRCGKAIVQEANKIVPDFYAHPDNPEGMIGRGVMEQRRHTPNVPFYRSLAGSGDMVLCRVNSFLVRECFGFVKEGIKANIQGRDIGDGLIRLVDKLSKKLPADTIPDLVAALDDWLMREVEIESNRRNPDEDKIVALNDKRDCVMCFTEGCRYIQQVKDKIGATFTDDKTNPGIKLSSIHKAKGLEARRVFLLEPKGAGVPHPMARTDWQRKQEWNLRYVAITRAIEKLYFVDGEGKPKR
jgi:hypothetical protein